MGGVIISWIQEGPSPFQDWKLKMELSKKPVHHLPCAWSKAQKLLKNCAQAWTHLVRECDLKVGKIIHTCHWYYVHATFWCCKRYRKGIPCNNSRVWGWGAGLPGVYSVIAEVNCKWQFVFTIYKLSMTGSALPKPPPFTQQGGEGDWARKAKSGLRQRKVNAPQPNHNFSENLCRSTLCITVK